MRMPIKIFYTKKLTKLILFWNGLKVKVQAKPLIAVVFLGVCLLFAGLIYVFTQHNNLSDAETIKDLFRIEVAVNEYADDHRELPLSLADLNSLHIKGKLSDYKYNYNGGRAFYGGPTVSYNLCASFRSSTLKLPIDREDSGGTSDGPSAYETHRKGLQCFGNDYYKTTSHIAPIFYESELTPPKPTKTYQQDFNALFSKTLAYYQSDMNLLRGTYENSDLKKSCVRNKDEFSDTPSKLVFTCYIEVQKHVPATANIPQGRDLMNQLLSLTAQQGFQYPFTQESADSDLSKYFFYIEPSTLDCKIEASYYPNWKPSTILYNLTCRAQPTSEVPAGYNLVDEDSQD